MSLLETINDDIKIAMKARDKESLAVMRMLKAALQNDQISKGNELSEDEELTVLSREMKQRRESLVEFKDAGREDLVEQTEAAIHIVGNYLPQQLSENELKAIIQEAITKVDAKSMKDFGSVMGVVMPLTKGKADGNEVNRLVKELLNA
ncbi:GatB/YqeY domain-containing protein [Carnobacterium pleistocenium]|uniref:GatB/YqeY domain-containing protein n=1 Tax=Carnobacterium pleistocenium TaxID=181073 RepID=UPI00054D78B9|nr:GatB/YqeY domain-containing protein [Carnobacterium pleistocenium]